ncbi:family 2 glycosyl transferase [Meridianimaribacter sp. CL38]|uniref:glycosyltransferase family 2 protein n=1 Tax=Meridianimaribacter sp. CL38 TaxID=2213021 RepID=UPI0010409A2D|nr:glycosyltransferase [Meridianimaribacter sp. CL38]TBV25514.1 family 2 glycosyl transferase [Meridianimaribacter sp. CL38]
MDFKIYTTSSNETLLYVGTPNFELLDALAAGPGDLWHSSMQQGFKNCFPELVYQTSAYWCFLNDFETDYLSVNWRVNVEAFVIRASVWEQIEGVDSNYSHPLMKGLDLGFGLIRTYFGIPLFVKGLFEPQTQEIKIPTVDRYYFFAKHFKKRHRFYMMLRQGVFKFPNELRAYLKTKNRTFFFDTPIKVRDLKPIEGSPTVSLVIPTMKRQAFTELLLKDYNAQTYPIKEAVIVDATPEAERDAQYYRPEHFNFDIKLKWQTTKGSCRARNEAIDLCTGDYIIFADDDVRVLPDFVEHHVKLLQTYNASACNGLDVMAEHTQQDLNDLKLRLDQLGSSRWRVGTSPIFSNANSCVRRDVVMKLQGNDINFDGGYGEDSDFGVRILKSGEVLLHNPFSANLHLKPPEGGYRFWGKESRILGKQRKAQPWELDTPVKWIRPVPSPTVTYGILKHYNPKQVKEWRIKHFFLYVSRGSKLMIPLKLVKLLYKQIQFNTSLFYARKLLKLGQRNS